MIYDWKQKSLYDAIETLRIDGACDDSMLLDHILQWLSSDDLEECIYDFVVDNNLESDYIEGESDYEYEDIE